MPKSVFNNVKTATSVFSSIYKTDINTQSIWDLPNFMCISILSILNWFIWWRTLTGILLDILVQSFIVLIRDLHELNFFFHLCFSGVSLPEGHWHFNHSRTYTSPGRIQKVKVTSKNISGPAHMPPGATGDRWDNSTYHREMVIMCKVTVTHPLMVLSQYSKSLELQPETCPNQSDKFKECFELQVYITE